MKIVVAGTRGIPGIQGGVETHCEKLYPEIADGEHEVIIVRRPEYIQPENRVYEYKQVKIKDIKSMRSKHLEAFLHTLLATFYARRINADIIHIHAVGPSLMAPLARILGLKVVMTHHGADYNRLKWGRFAKFMLRLGERWGIRFSNHVITVSEYERRIIAGHYPAKKQLTYIPNGIDMPQPSGKKDFLSYLGIQEEKYILAVGRLVPEKGFDLLIEAFARFPDKSVKLVIAGQADHESDYSRRLKALAKENGVILTGFVKGEQLSQLYTHAALFVLPSFHEGLPISLLEAMSYSCNVLVSDIEVNKVLELPDNCYFSCGNTDSLSEGLIREYKPEAKPVSYNLSAYDWQAIACKTKQIYDGLF